MYRKYFDHTGKIITKQLVVPKHQRKELLYRIHNSKLKGHLGIKKTITEFRRKYYFPGFTEFLITYINNCLSCLQSKSVNQETIRPPLNPVSSNTSFPADLLEVDIVGQLPKSGGYSYIVKAMDVFSKYLFAQVVTSPSAEVVAKTLMQWFMRHSYIPMGILTDKGSAFTSSLIRQLAEMLEIQLNHATVKHAQTIGLLERSHRPLKRYLKIYENQTKHDWHKFVDLAVFQHNTSYHTVLGSPPSLIFHGRIPFNPIDLRFNNKTLPKFESKFDYISDLQSKMSTLFGETKESLVLSFNKYRDYYDKKSKAFPLKVHEYCMLLNPQISNTHEKLGKLECKWTGIYRIEKILTRSNYLIRKVNTNFTQIVHRVRLKPFKPQYKVEDIQLIDDKNFCEDPLIPEVLKEPQLFDCQVEHIVYRPIDSRSTPSVITTIKTQLPKTSEIPHQPRPKTPRKAPENVSQTTTPTLPPSQSPSPTFKTPPDDLPDKNDILSSPTKEEFNEPGPSSTPTSNLAKILARKKQERDQQRKAPDSTQQPSIPSSQNQTELQTKPSQIPKPKGVITQKSGTQLANTTSKYGRQRKQTQFFGTNT